MGIFEEWCDIVRWLPSIAANSDMDKQQWDQINQACEGLSNLVTSLSSDQPASEKRNLYRKNAQEISRTLQNLNQVVEEYSQTDAPSATENNSSDDRGTRG